MQIEKVLNKMIRFFGNDIRRINHALKVYAFANTICRNEKLSNSTIEITEIAAILHDIGIPAAEKKYNSSAGKYQEIEGPPIAKKILEELNCNSEILNRVLYLIGHHHTYSLIDNLDFQILVEADFLVNIYEGNLENVNLEKIRERYFKTTNGKALFDSMYLKK